MITGALALIVIPSAFDAAFAPASVACAVKLLVAAPVGVPLIIPVDGASDKPAGSAPAVTAHVSAPKPPEPASVCEYAAPTVPAAIGVAVVTARFELIVIVNAFVAATPALSKMRAVKFATAPVCAVPPIAPVAGTIAKPAGSDPALIDHVNGAVPPEFASVCEYAAPVVPPGIGLAVVTAGTAFARIDNAFVAVAARLSVTCTVKLLVAAVAGVPEISPVADASVSPPGNAPLARVHA